MHDKSFQSCLTLCDPMDCSLPGSSVHGILQTRILKCMAMPCPPPGYLPNPETEPISLSSLVALPTCSKISECSNNLSPSVCLPVYPIILDVYLLWSSFCRCYTLKTPHLHQHPNSVYHLTGCSSFIP